MITISAAESPSSKMGGGGFSKDYPPPPPIPLDGDSATIRNFGQNDTNCSRIGKSAVEAQ